MDRAKKDEKARIKRLSRKIHGTEAFEGKITVTRDGQARLNLQNDAVKKRLRAQLNDVKEMDVEKSPA